MKILYHHLPEGLCEPFCIMNGYEYKVSRFFAIHGKIECYYGWSPADLYRDVHKVCHFQHPAGRLSNHILPYKLRRDNGNCILRDHQKIDKKCNPEKSTAAI